MKNIKKIVTGLLKTTVILPIHRIFLLGIINYFIMIKTYLNPENARAFNLIKKIKKETTMLLHDFEAYQIYMTVKKTNKIRGDIAEVGAYKGGSAKLICESTNNKSVHLFDTFEGLPDLSKKDDQKQLNKGQYASQFEYVKNLFKNYTNVYFYKGFFPKTSGPIKNIKFSFVHLDVDLYESTLSCLKFFYPRMNRGGVIISHDYSGLKGVRKAFDEFFDDKPEIIIEQVICDQCLVVKL